MPCHLEGWLTAGVAACCRISTTQWAMAARRPTEPNRIPVDPDPGPVLPVIVELIPRSLWR